MKTRLISRSVALAVGAACAGTKPQVKPDDMRAAEHRQAAQHERELVQQSSAKYSPSAARVSPLAPPAALDSGLLTALDAAHVEELRNRSREEAVYVQHDRQ